MIFRPQNNLPCSWRKIYRTHENMKFWFISTSKNKSVYFFSVGLPPQWYDDGKYHEFLSCFNKSSTNPFYFTSLLMQTLTAKLQVQQKLLLTRPPLVLFTVANSSLPLSCCLHIVFMYGY